MCTHMHASKHVHTHTRVHPPHTHTPAHTHIADGTSWRVTEAARMLPDLSVGWFAGSSTVKPSLPDAPIAKFTTPFTL